MVSCGLGSGLDGIGIAGAGEGLGGGLGSGYGSAGTSSASAGTSSASAAPAGPSSSALSTASSACSPQDAVIESNNVAKLLSLKNCMQHRLCVLAYKTHISLQLRVPEHMDGSLPAPNGETDQTFAPPSIDVNGE